MRRLLACWALALTVFLASCTPATEGLSKVARVIDGDTIEIAGGVRVRYIGIDAPEVHSGEEAYGREAWAVNREMVEGKLVRLEKDVSERDRYGRLLRYVYVDDVFVNGELVRLGCAQSVAYAPDTKHQRLLDELEDEARDAHRGLWLYAP